MLIEMTEDMYNACDMALQIVIDTVGHARTEHEEEVLPPLIIDVVTGMVAHFVRVRQELETAVNEGRRK